MRVARSGLCDGELSAIRRLLVFFVGVDFGIWSIIYFRTLVS
jgi:hypothetical protein